MLLRALLLAGFTILSGCKEELATRDLDIFVYKNESETRGKMGVDGINVWIIDHRGNITPSVTANGGRTKFDEIPVGIYRVAFLNFTCEKTVKNFVELEEKYGNVEMELVVPSCETGAIYQHSIAVREKEQTP